jgi:hypothetical protein
MSASGKRGYGLLGMQIVGRANMDDVGSLSGKQLIQVVIRSAQAEGRGRRQCPTANGDDLAAEFASDSRVNARDIAAAYDGYPQSCLPSDLMAAPSRSQSIANLAHPNHVDAM